MDDRTEWLRYIDQMYAPQKHFWIEICHREEPFKRVVFKFYSHQPVDRKDIEKTINVQVYADEQKDFIHHSRLWVSADVIVALAHFYKTVGGGSHDDQFKCACRAMSVLILNSYRLTLAKEATNFLEIVLYWRKQAFFPSAAQLLSSVEREKIFLNHSEIYRCLEGAPGAGKSTIGPYLVQTENDEFFIPENVCFLYSTARGLTYWEKVGLIENLREQTLIHYDSYARHPGCSFLVERKPWGVLNYLFTPRVTTKLYEMYSSKHRPTLLPLVPEHVMPGQSLKELKTMGMTFVMAPCEGIRCPVETDYTLTDDQINKVIQHDLEKDARQAYGLITTAFYQDEKEFDYMWSKRPKQKKD